MSTRFFKVTFLRRHLLDSTFIGKGTECVLPEPMARGVGSQVAKIDREALPGELTGFVRTIPTAYTVIEDDDSQTLKCSAATTLTLTPTSYAAVIVYPPASGNLTIGRSGGVTLNGVAADLTRTFASNRLGVAIVPNPHVAGDFTVSGA